MKFTEYFLYTRQRPDRKSIKNKWIEHVILFHEKEEIQDDGRIRRWAFIKEENKYLRVVLLSDGETVHNAFFDRDFRR
jgi:hypothetical protein